MVGSFTKSIKVRRLEAALRVAVAAQHDAPPGKLRTAKTKSVRKLAAKLLAARMQVLRSRAADLQPLMPKEPPRMGLRSRIERMQTAGISAILAEFGAPES